MKNKKILFVMPHLYTGGITTAFLNLINNLDKNDIYVLLFNPEHKEKIPDKVNIVPTNIFLRLITTPQNKINKESKLFGILRLFLGGIAKLIGSQFAYRLIFLTCSKLKGFDCAISFSQSSNNHSLFGGMNEFVLDKVNADAKVTFLHCDYSECGIHSNYSQKIYSQFDKIAAVSEGVRNSFVKTIPELADKTCVVHNCHQFEKIEKMSFENTVIYKDDAIKFLTVARISSEKGHYRALEAFKKLKSEGFDFYWHIVGGADDNTEATFQRCIDDAGLTNNVIMHHTQENPYRFFVNADALLLPSYHEAAPMVFSEAEILNLPILTTDTTSAEEFVSSKNIGIVCSNTDEAIYQMLKDVLQKPELLAGFKRNMKIPTNESALNEFYDLIDK